MFYVPITLLIPRTINNNNSAIVVEPIDFVSRFEQKIKIIYEKSINANDDHDETLFE